MLAPSRRLVPALGLALALLCAREPALAAAACPAVRPTFTNSAPEARYERDYGILDIERLAQQRGQKVGADQRVTGLYLAKVVAQTEVTVSGRREGGLVAACFATFHASLALSATVHVASEFPTGSCAERAVTEHEFHHHRIQIASQEQAVAAFLAQNPLPSTPFLGADENAAREAARQWANAYVAALVQSADRFAHPMQEALDNPDEYRRVSGLCPGEFGRVFLARPKR